MSKSGSGPHALPQQERARDRGGHGAEAPRVQDDLEAPRRRARGRPGVPLAPYSSFDRRDGSKLRLQISPDVRRRIIDEYSSERGSRSPSNKVRKLPSSPSVSAADRPGLDRSGMRRRSDPDSMAPV